MPHYAPAGCSFNGRPFRSPCCPTFCRDSAFVDRAKVGRRRLLTGPRRGTGRLGTTAFLRVATSIWSRRPT